MITSSMAKWDQKPIFKHFIMIIYLDTARFPPYNKYVFIFSLLLSFSFRKSVLLLRARLSNHFAFQINDTDIDVKKKSINRKHERFIFVTCFLRLLKYLAKNCFVFDEVFVSTVYISFCNFCGFFSFFSTLFSWPTIVCSRC